MFYCDWSAAESYDAAEARADKARFRSDIGTDAASDQDEPMQSRKRRFIWIFDSDFLKRIHLYKLIINCLL